MNNLAKRKAFHRVTVKHFIQLTLKSYRPYLLRRVEYAPYSEVAV